MVKYTFCSDCGKVVDEFENSCGWCSKIDQMVEKKFESWYNGPMSDYTLVSEWFLLDLALFDETDDLHQHRAKMVNWLKAAFKEGYNAHD